MYSRSSTIPANWVKIGPVDVEIIGRTESLKIKNIYRVARKNVPNFA